MPVDEPRSGNRINLAAPGARPKPPRSRRGIRIALAVVAVAALAAGGVAAREPLARGAGEVWEAWSAWSTGLRDRAAAVPDPPPTTTMPPPEPVASRSLLITVGSGPGDAGLALLAQPPFGQPELVMIPQTLLVQVPGFGEFSMAEALAFGGPRLARLALVNETGLRIDDTAVVAAGGLAAVAEDLLVDVPVELFVEGGDGSRRLIAAGPQQLSIDLAELLLVEQGSGNQFDWLRRQEAVWEAVLAAIEADGDVAAALAAGASDPGAAAALLEIVAGGGRIAAPPLDRVAIGASRDALVLATDRVDDYLAGDLGHLALREGRRPRAEVLNGNGVAGSGIPVAEVLVEAGYYVLRSGNADRFDYAASRVIAQGEDAAAAAREAAAALGIQEVLLEAQAPSGVVDVSIIVGTDLAPKEG